MVSEEEAVNPDEALLQFIVFQLGSEYYAAEIHRIKEILRYRNVTRMPGSPGFIEGVIELRGRIVPVIDLRKRIGLDPAVAGSLTRIIVIRNKKRNIGMIVDVVERVITVPIENLQSPPEIASGTPYVLAVARYQDGLYIILDFDRLLTSEETLSFDRLSPNANHS